MCAFKKHFWIGLAIDDEIGIDNGVKQIGDAESLQNGRGIFTRAGEACLEARSSDGFERFACAREQVGLVHVFDEFNVVIVFNIGLGDFFGFGECDATVCEDQIERVHATNAFELLVELVVEIKAEATGKFLPRDEVKFCGVGDDAIEVEDEGLNLGHGLSLIEYSGELCESSFPNLFSGMTGYGC